MLDEFNNNQKYTLFRLYRYSNAQHAQTILIMLTSVVNNINWFPNILGYTNKIIYEENILKFYSITEIIIPYSIIKT